MVCRFLSLSFACLVLLSIGVNGQKTDINAYRQNTMDNTYSYGKLRLNGDGKNEELIPVNDGEKIMIPKNDQIISVQPLPTACAGARPSTKVAHPTDKTKYIQCRDEFHYEIFHCPDNGEFDEQTKSCLMGTQIVDKCLLEKPCLNEGECMALSNSTFKCTCRSDWTGDRCETPLNACATKPCGPLGECRSLRIADFQQDYVCVCRGRKEYGPNCQDVVPNPCTFGSDQYYPFAFNPRAYVQCDGEMIHIQPCGPMLFWNQEERYCDRKRPTTVSSKKLIKKTTVATPVEYEPESNNVMNTLDSTTTLPNLIVLEPIKTSTQQMRAPMMEQGFRFVPTRVSNRPAIPETQNQGYGSAEFTPSRVRPLQQQVFRPDMQPVDTTIKTPLIPVASSLRGRSWQPTLPPQPVETINIQPVQSDQILSGTENQQQLIPQQTQTYGGQQWTSNNNQRFPTQSWQQNPSQNTFMETTTLAQPIFRSHGMPMRDQDQSRHTFVTSNNQFMPSVDMRTSSLPTFTGRIPETTTFENRLRFTTDLPSQQQWQNPQMNSVRPVVTSQQERPFPDMQRMRMDQQWSTTTQSNIPMVESGAEQLQMIPQQTQTYGGQQWTSNNNQRFPTQSWQQNPSQNTFMETTTLAQPIFRPHNSQLLSAERPESARSNQFLTQQTLNQPLASQTNQWQEQSQQATQLNTNDESRTLADASATIRPNGPTFMNQQGSSNGQFLSNIPESTTMMNSFNAQGSTVPTLSGWRAMRTNDLRQTVNPGFVQQPIETRRTADSIPSSWRSRMQSK